VGVLTIREEAAMSQLLLDRAGRQRSPATLPGFNVGHAPGNKGHRYPADPPKVEEIVAVMRAAGDRPHGRRMRALTVIRCRAGLRIYEALELTEGDLDEARGALLVRRGKGGRRREVGMDAWAWDQLQPWLEIRRQLPVGPLLCASSPVPPMGATGLRPPHARSCAGSLPLPVCAVASPRISSATPTPLRWLAKACR
jgi:integrase